MQVYECTHAHKDRGLACKEARLSIDSEEWWLARTHARTTDYIQEEDTTQRHRRSLLKGQSFVWTKEQETRVFVNFNDAGAPPEDYDCEYE